MDYKIKMKNILECVTKIEDIQETAEEIAKARNVKAIYLFGSHVSGKNHNFSDIDLCIISGNEEQEDSINYPVTDKLDVSFFHSLPISMQFRVLKEGKSLIIKDKDFVNNLKIKTLREYLDFKNLINRYCIERFGCTI